MKKIILNENCYCIIGKNKEENWKLLEKAKKEDENKKEILLFHVCSFPSCYVLLYNTNQEEKINSDIIEKVSKICLENTKYKNLKNIYVDYTNLENVLKSENEGEIEYISKRKVYKIRLN